MSRERQIGIVFETASPFDTPKLMTELVDWFTRAREERQLHPLLLIAVFHRRLPRNPSFPGWKRALKPSADDAAVVAGRLRLRALQLA